MVLWFCGMIIRGELPNHFLVLFLALLDRLPFVVAVDPKPGGKLTNSGMTSFKTL